MSEQQEDVSNTVAEDGPHHDVVDDESVDTDDGEVGATATTTTTTTTTPTEGGRENNSDTRTHQPGALTLASSTTFASNSVPTGGATGSGHGTGTGGGGFDMGWTQLGVGADDVLPLRYPHDVTDWTVEETEIYVVGTAGQKITTLGEDFTIKSKLTNPKLERLILRSHLIRSMDNLADLTQLQLLELYDNMVQTLDEDSLKGCGPSLQTLDMSFNSIRDMTPVQLCTGNLTELYIANNKIKTISGLKNLIHLKKIDLGANRIRVIDGNELNGLVNLEELWIGKNKIEEITGLEKVRTRYMRSGWGW
jgi:Leucine-rich repeat (LRR) protein